GSLPPGPLDEPPLYFSSALAPHIPMSRADTQACEARTHDPTVTLPPGDGLPSGCGQCAGQIVDREWALTLAASDQGRWSSMTAIGRRRQGLRARAPYRRLAGDPHHVGNAALRECLPKRCHHAESGIGNHGRQRHPVLAQPIDLVEGDLPLRLEAHRLGDPRLSPAPTIIGPY